MTKRVFIAEDEPNILESLSFLLGREGWEVTSALDGNSALEQLNAGSLPDVVILDIMLPHRNGFDILRQLRASPRTRDLPVIVLTAKGQEKDRKTAEEIGANAFVTKPFSNKDVVDQVRRLAGL
ncbi:response regulator transcription factor [Nisaea nitritireducens]|uniref:response regulator transcription factor n=1 Tax=Nisaea nitritireducens TaxID=568392 RepID=UPI001869217C|nr:response regulator [Nisaea nitritireducens]